MIVKRSTTKKCDICNRVVAVKGHIRFATMKEYVTLRSDWPSAFYDTARCDVHICNDCWEGMKAVVRTTLDRKDG